MRVVIGADHAGYELKQQLLPLLRSEGCEVLDAGTDSSESVDYPDYAEAVAEALVDDRAERGILICGSGVGASVAANKIPDVRAGLCHDTYSARQAVEHDDVNVLVLGARVIGIEVAKELVSTFLNAEFSGDDRHHRRLRKVKEIEKKHLRDPGS